jgi:hypothetical protein
VKRAQKRGRCAVCAQQHVEEEGEEGEGEEENGFCTK